MSYDEMFSHLVTKRTVPLFRDIDAEKQEDITTAIALLNSQSANPIKFLLDSEGGSVSHTLIVYDAIAHSEAPVNGLVMGKAHSGAFLISQAFHNRIAYPHATFMIHGPSLHGLRSDEENLAGKIKFRKLLHQKMLALIAKRTGQSMKKLRIWSREERFFTAKEALKLNFIDKIAEPPK